jgi:hypothetical protein
MDEPPFRRTVTLLAPLLAVPIAAAAVIGALVNAKPTAQWLRFIGQALPWLVLVFGLNVVILELAIATRRSSRWNRRRRELDAVRSGARRPSRTTARAAELGPDPVESAGRISAWALAAVILTMSTLLIDDAALRGAVDLVLAVAFISCYAASARHRRRAMLKTCPDCAELVKVAARVCRYCGFRFNAATSPGAPLSGSTARELLAVSPVVLKAHREVVENLRYSGHFSEADWLAACNGIEDVRAVNAMLNRRLEADVSLPRSPECERVKRLIAALIDVYEDGDDITPYRKLFAESQFLEPPAARRRGVARLIHALTADGHQPDGKPAPSEFGQHTATPASSDELPSAKDSADESANTPTAGRSTSHGPVPAPADARRRRPHTSTAANTSTGGPNTKGAKPPSPAKPGKH